MCLRQNQQCYKGDYSYWKWEAIRNGIYQTYTNIGIRYFPLNFKIVFIFVLGIGLEKQV